MATMVTSQITIFLFSLILGVCLSLLFDGFRIVNAVLKVNLKRIFFQDLIYFISSAIFTFLFVLVVNSGEIRFYIICGEIIGWMLYHVTVGKFFYKIFLTVVKFFCKWFSKLKKFVISKFPKEKWKNLICKLRKLKPKFIKNAKFKNRFLQKMHHKTKNKPNFNFDKNIC